MLQLTSPLHWPRRLGVWSAAGPPTRRQAHGRGGLRVAQAKLTQ